MPPLLHRRALLGAGLASLIPATAAHAAPAPGSDWPSRPIRLIVPYPAGGAADQTARGLATVLGERLKTPIIIDNRPGAGGSIGAAAVAQAPADGYTLLLDATGFTVNPSLMSLPFDPVKDLAPLSLLMQVPMLLVVPAQAPWRSLPELVQAARARPGSLSFASAGNGSAQHLAGELFKQRQQLFITHIPYRGGAPALNDLMAGQVDLMFSAMPASGPLVKGGKLRALAVTASARVPSLPALPTVAESGSPGFVAQEWNGLWAPAKTPPEILSRLETEVRAAMASPELQQRLAAQGAQAVGSSRADFSRFLQAESRQWAQVIRTAGITLN